MTPNGGYQLFNTTSKSGDAHAASYANSNYYPPLISGENSGFCTQPTYSSSQFRIPYEAAVFGDKIFFSVTLENAKKYNDYKALNEGAHVHLYILVAANPETSPIANNLRAISGNIVSDDIAYDATGEFRTYSFYYSSYQQYCTAIAMPVITKRAFTYSDTYAFGVGGCIIIFEEK